MNSHIEGERITRGQLTCINVLLRKLNICGIQKEAMVLGFSSSRTASISGLYLTEAIAVIRHLKSMDPEERQAETMRRKIISMAHEMGWKLPDGRADIKSINNWCVKYGYLHKKLNQYNYQELPLLVTTFEKLYQQYLNAMNVI